MSLIIHLVLINLAIKVTHLLSVNIQISKSANGENRNPILWIQVHQAVKNSLPPEHKWMPKFTKASVRKYYQHHSCIRIQSSKLSIPMATNFKTIANGVNRNPILSNKYIKQWKLAYLLSINECQISQKQGKKKNYQYHSCIRIRSSKLSIPYSYKFQN